jgi:hypothetical protein
MDMIADDRYLTHMMTCVHQFALSMLAAAGP